MGRIRQEILVNRRPSWTLFDSGARNTYVVPEVTQGLSVTVLPSPTYSKLGGETKRADRIALLVGELDGKAFHTEALVVDSIGQDDDGRPIEVLFGALAMQQWGIRLAMAEERLDLSHYPDEFVEY